MKNSKLIVAAAISGFAISLIIFSSSGVKGALNGINLCYYSVIPSLFPFMVCSTLLYEFSIFEDIAKRFEWIFKRIFMLNALDISIFLLSIIGGYPIGANLINKAFNGGKISKKKAELLLRFCVNAGPSFIVGVIGTSILKNNIFGYILLLSNTLASIIIIFLSRSALKKELYCTTFEITKAHNFTDGLVKSTYDASSAMLGICAYIVLFSCISGILSEHISITEISNLISTLLEITSGIAFLEKNLFYISFLIGFAGICIHFQIFSICSEIKLSYFRFLMCRIFHGFLAAIITYITTKITGVSVATIQFNDSFLFETTKYSTLFSLSLMLLSILFIISVKRKSKII